MISAAGKLQNISAVKNLRRIRTFSPLRRKERKGRQEIPTCMLLLRVLRVLRVFAVKILELVKPLSTQRKTKNPNLSAASLRTSRLCGKDS